VLACPRHQARNHVGDAPVAIRRRRREQRVVITHHLERNCRERRHRILKPLGARDEIGFRVEFDDGASRTFHQEAHKAFGGHTTGLLRGLGGLGGAQTIDRGVEIACVSASAFLQAMTPAPVLSRSVFTSVALIPVMLSRS
jgi:hypothetical protein